MQLFYHPEISETDLQVIFPREESKHIVKVLRKNEGDVLQITDGKGKFFTTEITAAGTNKCIAKLISVEEIPADPYQLHLAVAPTKMNDRYEWFLEKATEIGVHEITPIICEHSERKVIKPERFERVLQSAMKQSLQAYLPKLNEAISFADFISNYSDHQKYIAHCEEGLERKTLASQIKRNTPKIILIGPEGDFSNEEIRTALHNNWQPVSLGNNRLRTETAAIVACHTVRLIEDNPKS